MKGRRGPRGVLALAGMLAVLVGLPGIAVARDDGTAGAIPLGGLELCELLAEAIPGGLPVAADGGALATEPADVDLLEEILDALEDVTDTLADDVVEEIVESLRAVVAVLDRPRFQAVGPFSVGGNPVSVAVGDFDTDDRPDLAVANSGSANVSVLVNSTGSGVTVAFTTAATPAVGTNPSSVAVGDLNGDGLPDIAVANKNAAGTVSVVRNTTVPGIMSFAAAVGFGVGTSPSSVALADFDPQSKPDLAVANDAVAGTARVRRNTTPTATPAVAPTFAPFVTSPVGSNPSSVAVGDFNNDDKPDLAVANSVDGTVSVLVNTTAVLPGGPLTFGSGPTPTVGPNPSSVAVGDFNDDDKPDLAVANNAAAPNNTVSVLLNTTAGGSVTFATRMPFVVGTDPSSVAVADFNGDDRPDLAVANRGSDNVSVLLGDGQGVFGPAANFTVGEMPTSVAVGDFNDDDLPDLAVTNVGPDNVSVLVNTTATPSDSSTSTVAARSAWRECHVPKASTLR